MVRTAGDYALLHANGMSWKDVINLVRVETLEWKSNQENDWIEQKERDETDEE